MNWLDIVVLVLLALGAIGGLRTGLFGAAFAAAGALIGWFVAGQLSDDIGGLFSGSISNDTLVTVISYALIIVLSLVIARLAWKLVRPVLTALTLGLAALVDKLGGLVLGLVLGGAIAGALIIAMARFTYNFTLPEEGIAGTVVERMPLVRVEETREGIRDTLAGSRLVPVFIKVVDALPGDALGFVPSDFRVALDLLKQDIEKESAS